jgi:hypothetical protein
MSQSWTDNTYQSDHVSGTDLQNMENNFGCLKTMFSGSSAPSGTVAGMPWYDTNKNLLKIRNNANDAWYGAFQWEPAGGGEPTTLFWIYSNSAIEGWVIDSSLTDRVLALKGGSQAYNVNGGNVGGTWQLPDHTLTTAEIPPHSHSIAIGWAYSAWVYLSGVHVLLGGVVLTGATGGGGAHNHGNTWRPYAAVGTLQYLDFPSV